MQTRKKNSPQYVHSLYEDEASSFNLTEESTFQDDSSENLFDRKLGQVRSFQGGKMKDVSFKQQKAGERSALLDNCEKKILTQDKNLTTLSSLVIKNKRDWKKIARDYNKMMNSEFTAKSLRDIFNEIKPIPKRQKFTKKIDQELKKQIKKHGLDFVKISTFFPGRSALSLRNRYYLLRREKKIKTRRSKEKIYQIQPLNLLQSEYRAIDLNIKVNEIDLTSDPYWMKLVNHVK